MKTPEHHSTMVSSGIKEGPELEPNHAEKRESLGQPKQIFAVRLRDPIHTEKCVSVSSPIRNNHNVNDVMIMNHNVN